MTYETVLDGGLNERPSNSLSLEAPVRCASIFYYLAGHILRTSQTTVLRGKLAHRTTLHDAGGVRDNFALYHGPSIAYICFIEFGLTSDWCLLHQSASDVGLDVYIFAKVAHVVGSAARSAAHWRRVGLTFKFALEALGLVLDGQAFSVEFRASEIVAQRLATFAPA